MAPHLVFKHPVDVILFQQGYFIRAGQVLVGTTITVVPGETGTSSGNLLYMRYSLTEEEE